MVSTYLQERFEKFEETYRRLGLKATLKKILYALKRLIYMKHVEFLLEKDLHDEIKFSFEYTLPEITSMGERHLNAMGDLCKRSRNKKYPLRVFDDYLRNNSQCFIIELKDKVIGYVWWVNTTWGSDSKILDSRFYRNELKLKEDEVYLFDALIDPQYRGGHNSLELFLKVFSALKKQGYKRAFGSVRPENTPARWIYKLLGYDDIKKVVERRFFQLLVFKGGKIFFDLSSL